MQENDQAEKNRGSADSNIVYQFLRWYGRNLPTMNQIAIICGLFEDIHFLLEGVFNAEIEPN